MSFMVVAITSINFQWFNQPRRLCHKISQIFLGALLSYRINPSALTESFTTTLDAIHSLTRSCWPVTSKVSLLLVSSFPASHG